MARCPDCDGFKGSFGVLGNGVCAECHGNKLHYSPASEAGTFSQDYQCKKCGGTGKCQTCGGTGELDDGFET